MRVNGKQTKHNERMTFSQIEYLRERVETLVKNLEKKGYDVSYEKSSMSESTYITINDQTISFRNHDYFNGTVKDHTVWVSRFDNWSEAKKHFMNNILPVINGEKIEKEEQPKRESNESLIAEAKKKLDATNDPSMKMILKSRIKHLEGLA